MALGENPTSPGSHPVPIQRMFNERKKARFLTELGKTGSIKGAAAVSGVHVSTVYDHAKADPMFGEAIERARGVWEQGLLHRIDRAVDPFEVVGGKSPRIEPGDWRAAAWLLEHAPASRERYAGVLRSKVEIGGDPDGVPVQTQNLNIDIDLGPDTMERLARVVQVLIASGKLRLPDPGEIVIEGEVADGDG